ncbi:hypothetical protein K466DRAFT_502996, partial [Polyporus arcularius HHB13444]
MDITPDEEEEDQGPIPDRDNDGPNPEYGYTEDQGAPRDAHRRAYRDAQKFVQLLQTAELETSGLDQASIDRLQHPPHETKEVTDHQLAGFQMYMARGDASEQNYTDHRNVHVFLHPEDEEIPTYEHIKKLAEEHTGIRTIRTDMCVNTCCAFTGPYAEKEKCPFCKEDR